jgi:CBS domain-containing protein
MTAGTAARDDESGILRMTALSRGGRMKIRDVMVREVTTVAPETSLKDVASVLAERGISGLPVVDSGGAVVGVVSEADILVKERAGSGRRGGVLGWLLGTSGVDEAAKLEARTAGEAMTSPAITVEPDRSVAYAAGVMVDRGVNRLPVVDGGELLGIVTRADLVRAFTREDGELAREIREDVVLKQFWIAPETVTVEVRRGEVRISGEVEKKSVAELLASFVERVPGVVAVNSSLTWREDDRP